MSKEPRWVWWELAAGHHKDATKNRLFRAIWMQRTLPYAICDRKAYVDLDVVTEYFDALAAAKPKQMTLMPALNGPLAAKDDEVVAA